MHNLKMAFLDLDHSKYMCGYCFKLSQGNGLVIMQLITICQIKLKDNPKRKQRLKVNTMTKVHVN